MKNPVPHFFVCLVLALTACAASQNLNIKPGLWETTTELQGQPAIPAAQKAEMEKQMAKMSPEMRARIEAAQKRAVAQPLVQKSCITKEDLASKSGPLGNDKDVKCTQAIVKSTSTYEEVKVECASEKYKSTGVMRITATNTENWTGTMETTLTPAGGGAATTAKMNMTGKWLGAACGDVKPRSQK